MNDRIRRMSVDWWRVRIGWPVSSNLQGYLGLVEDVRQDFFWEHLANPPTGDENGNIQIKVAGKWRDAAWCCVDFKGDGKSPSPLTKSNNL